MEQPDSMLLLDNLTLLLGKYLLVYKLNLTKESIKDNGSPPPP